MATILDSKINSFSSDDYNNLTLFLQLLNIYEQSKPDDIKITQQHNINNINNIATSYDRLSLNSTIFNKLGLILVP